MISRLGYFAANKLKDGVAPPVGETHRYWRLRPLSFAYDGSGLSFGSMRMYDTGGNERSVAATLSSNSEATGFEVDLLQDGDPDTRWGTDGGTLEDMSIVADFGAGNEYEIVQFSLTTKSSFYDIEQTGNQWAVEYSDDGSTWTEHWRTIEYGGIGNSLTTYTWSKESYLANSEPCHFYKLVATSAEAGGSFFSIGEIDFRSATDTSNKSNGALGASSWLLNRTPDDAEDNDPLTELVTETSGVPLPQEVIKGLETAITLQDVQVSARGDSNASQAPRDFTVWRSNGETWVKIGDYTNQIGWSLAETRTFVPVDYEAHRHWRVRITGVVSGDQTSIRELRFKESFSDTAYMTGGTASASSVSSSGHVASRAFDGSDDIVTGNFWTSSGTDLSDGEAWLAYDFGEGNERPCVGIIITTTGVSDNTNPTDFDVQYSDDGSTWTTAWSESLNQGVSGTKIFMNKSAYPNRLVNGDWETGDKTGWTNGTNGSDQVVDTETSGAQSPLSGTYCLDTPTSGSDPTTFQEIDLTKLYDTADIDAGGLRCILYEWGINWSGTDDDQTQIKWEWLDGSGALIGTAITDEIDSDTWSQIGNGYAGEVAPVGSRKVRISIISVLNTGATANVAHDNSAVFFEMAA